MKALDQFITSYTLLDTLQGYSLCAYVDIPLHVGENFHAIIASPKCKSLSDNVISEQDKRDMRDSLILLILLVNAQRNSTLPGLIGRDISSAKLSEDGSTYTIEVEILILFDLIRL